VVAEVGKLTAFWAAIPHQIIDFASETVYLVATIPLPYFLQWRLPEDFVQPLLQGRFLSESSATDADTDARLFERWEADLQNNAPEIEWPVLLEMQARLTRFALHLGASINADTKRDRFAGINDEGLTKVERMACFVAKNYTEKLTVKQISEFVGLNPNYAMNLFQKAFGTTLTNYLVQHRVSHAQRLLITTNLSITEIALQSGFRSISRFNEAFCRICGSSPRDYRKTHRIV
jgi:AraC-like DNA-binding protein